jgi:hypothetical protein
MIESTINRARSQPRPLRAEAAVLVCIPFGRSLFWANRWLPSPVLNTLGWVNDYAAQISREYDNHRQYQQTIELPLRLELRALRAMGVTVLSKVEFGTFRAALKGRHRVVILVAHHIDSGVEFYDGLRSWDTLRPVIIEASDGRSLAFLFVVCDSEDWKRQLVPLRKGPGELAAFAWEIDPLQSVKFARAWLAELDGNRTLLEAQDLAIRRIWGTTP